MQRGRLPSAFWSAAPSRRSMTRIGDVDARHIGAHPSGGTGGCHRGPTPGSEEVRALSMYDHNSPIAYALHVLATSKVMHASQ